MREQEAKVQDANKENRSSMTVLRRVFLFCLFWQLGCTVIVYWLYADAVVFQLGGVLVAWVIYQTAKGLMQPSGIEEKPQPPAGALEPLMLLNLAQEVRTPASAVFAYLDLMQRGNSWVQLTDLVRHAKTAVQYVMDVTQNMSEVSKLQVQKIRLEVGDVDLHALLLDVESMVKVLADRKNIGFYINVQPNIPSSVRVDGVRLKQVLLNFLNNAVKFTHQGCVSLDVSATPHGEGMLFEFSVQDSGADIPPEQINHLLKPFNPLSGQSTKMYEGFALGVCVSKRLVDLMGGTVHYRPKQPSGNEFVLRFPLECVRSTDAARQQGVSAELSEEMPLKGHRILLVEDTDMLREIASRCLRLYGAEVDCASNGVEAVAAVLQQKNHYDLVLMDIQMPEMDGLTASRQIRQSLSEHDLPIVALSGHTSWHEIKQSLDAGMNAHFQKPMKVEDVLGFLNSFSHQWVQHPTFQKKDCLTLLDPDQGLSNFSGDKQIYFNALMLFRNQLDVQKGAMSTVNWVDSSEVISYLHRLKSMALTIGAIQMGWLADQMHIQALESSLDSSAESSLRVCINCTREALDEFVSANSLGAHHEVADSRR